MGLPRGKRFRLRRRRNFCGCAGSRRQAAVCHYNSRYIPPKVGSRGGSESSTVGYESLLLYINFVLNQSLLNPLIVRLLVITIEH